MNCENCQKEHDGTFGSGRFCCKPCSRAFSTKSKRSDINAKVSDKLTGRKLSYEHRQNLKMKWEDESYRNSKRRVGKPIEELLIEKGFVSTQHVKRRLIAENIKLNVCEDCGICDTYNDKPIVHQLHHINGNPKDHRLENLQLLCPNCHSQTHNWAGRKRL